MGLANLCLEIGSTFSFLDLLGMRNNPEFGKFHKPEKNRWCAKLLEVPFYYFLDTPAQFYFFDKNHSFQYKKSLRN